MSSTNVHLDTKQPTGTTWIKILVLRGAPEGPTQFTTNDAHSISGKFTMFHWYHLPVRVTVSSSTDHERIFVQEAACIGRIGTGSRLPASTKKHQVSFSKTQIFYFWILAYFQTHPCSTLPSENNKKMQMSVHIPTYKYKKQYIFDHKPENNVQSNSVHHVLVPMGDLSPPPPAEWSNHRAGKEESCQPSSPNVDDWPHEAHSAPFRNICKQKSVQILSYNGKPY